MTRVFPVVDDPDRYADVNPDHEAEEIRRQAWDVFVASLRDQLHVETVPMVLYDLGVAVANVVPSHELRSMQFEMRQFAEGYGWPDTLRAIAQAMQADETFQAEAEARR